MLDTILEKWQDILSFVKNDYDISDVSYNTWIVPLVPKKFEKDSNGINQLYFTVNDSLFQSIVSKKYSKLIEVGIEEVTGIKCNIILNTSDEDNLPNSSNKIINNYKNTVSASSIERANLNPEYTFDSFVVGKNNNIAHAASLAVAESPGDIYNPLFIYGGVGLGKTHLMQAIAHFVLEKNPHANVLYVTSETFTNELIDSIGPIKNKRNLSATDFRNKYRNIDVLLIDDIQFIIGKESTQEEFFHTFNALYESKKQIIISSDKPPRDFTTLEERLRSRFEWGLTVDIQPPDFETRMAILRKKEELEHKNIDNEVMVYIAENIKSNIRELEGALTQVLALGRLDNNREINIDLARAALADYITPNKPKKITVDLIIDVVCEQFNVSREDILGTKRNREIVYPRQIVMYLCRNLTDIPLQSIGKEIGGKDHSTVIHGIEKITKEIETNSDLNNNIDIIKKKLSPQ